MCTPSHTPKLKTKQRVSTGLADNPVRAISFTLAGAGGQEEDDWLVVEDDEALMKIVGATIKQGGVSMAPSLADVVSTLPKMAISVHVSTSGAGVSHSTANENTTPKQSRTDDVTPLSTIEHTTQHTDIEDELVRHINHSSGMGKGRLIVYILLTCNLLGIDKEQLFGVKWIQFIDSGGQLQYHDILPLFIQNPAVVIFVLKLSEELSHHPTIEYYGADGKPVGKPYRSSLSHKQILQQSWSNSLTGCSSSDHCRGNT